MRKPWHLYVVGVVALLWNAFGAADYTLIHLGVDDYTSMMPEAQLALIEGYPAWVTGIWAVAVWSPVAAALFLLGGRKIAAGLFALSFVCVLISGVYNYLISKPPLHEVAGIGVIGLWAGILAVAFLLWLYARGMAQRGVLE